MAKSRYMKVDELIYSLRTKSMIEAGYTDQEIIDELGLTKKLFKTFKKNIEKARKNLIWVL